jgi:hypothetical protein
MEASETFFSERENYTFSKNNFALKAKKFGKLPSKPDLLVSCLLCDTKFAVKYIPPKKQYSLKNN